MNLWASFGGNWNIIGIAIMWAACMAICGLLFAGLVAMFGVPRLRHRDIHLGDTKGASHDGR